jgi:hypothetical protein
MQQGPFSPENQVPAALGDHDANAMSGSNLAPLMIPHAKALDSRCACASHHARLRSCSYPLFSKVVIETASLFNNELFFFF